MFILNFIEPQLNSAEIMQKELLFVPKIIFDHITTKSLKISEFCSKLRNFKMGSADKPRQDLATVLATNPAPSIFSPPRGWGRSRDTCSLQDGHLYWLAPPPPAPSLLPASLLGLMAYWDQVTHPSPRLPQHRGRW